MASMDLSGINADAYNQYATMEAAQVSGNNLKATLNNTSSTSTDDELMDACKQFEAYLLEQVFKEMQKSVDALKDENSIDQPTSTLVDYFKGQTLTKITQDATETQGLGLAQMLYENMKRNYDI